jgi:hypothetical protein
MTFKEKWEQDHPDEEFSFTGHGTAQWRCPYKFGYEKLDADSNHCEIGCTACWNRQMPSLKAATMAFGKHEVEVPYSGREPIEYVDTAEFANTEPRILDSGERRQFETGAVRDIQEGKGRCDLMPLDVIYKYFELVNAQDKVLWWISSFQKNGLSLDLYNAIESFGTICWACDPATMFLELAKHFEEGAKKYGEYNWQKGIPVNRYIDSAVRHYLKWLRDDKDEPHDRAFVWNLVCCIWEVDFSPRAKGETAVADTIYKDNTPVIESLDDGAIREAKASAVYICDRKACTKCDNPVCYHTDDVRHAKNFEPVPGASNLYRERMSRDD